MQKTTLQIDGMTCQGCVNSVTRALQAVSGVADVQVDLASGQAKVDFNEQQTTPTALAAAVEDAGYDVKTA